MSLFPNEENILTKESGSWKDFEYALREENRILFNKMLSECCVIILHCKLGISSFTTYPRFPNLRDVIAKYYRTKRFNLDITKYLLRNVS